MNAFEIIEKLALENERRKILMMPEEQGAEQTKKYLERQLAE